MEKSATSWPWERINSISSNRSTSVPLKAKLYLLQYKILITKPPTLWDGPLDEHVAERLQVLGAVEVVANLHPGPMPDPVELLRRGKNVRRLIGTLVRVQERVDEEKPCDKIGQRSRFVQKTRLAGNDELWDTRDLRRQHKLAACHSLHQHQGNSFAA